jgi:hypothetical protein
MFDRSAKSVKPARISFYGNFGAGNLGNECTLQAVIEQILSGAWLPSVPDIAKMRAEWAIVCTARNLLKLAQESVCGDVDRLEARAAAA